jgi:threonylcarbamoyladenosine tRNA methylthiotransferase MtaB
MTDPQTLAPPERRLSFVTFGCKVNQYESAFMAETAVNLGFSLTSPREAEFLVVNTCTVTSRTDRQIRQILRQASRQAPAAKIIITGCYAQRAPQELAAFSNVRAVFGNLEKAFWPDLLPVLLTQEKLIQVSDLTQSTHYAALPVQHFHGHTRAFVKIQDGCNHGCTYCIVPSVRGPERSLPIPEVLKQIQVLINRGFKEIVLTGINLSRFGGDLPGEESLLTLVRRLKHTSWPARFRLSSVEPQDLSWEVIQELADWPQFCPHFHIPLQSGAAAVLTAMGRTYRPVWFEGLVQQIQTIFPRAAIGLDVMVGFPSEAAADFKETRDLLERLPVAYLHVFPYSPRPGTPAAGWRSLADSREIQARARDLRALSLHKKLAFYQRQRGQVVEVLLEGGVAGKPGWLSGLTGNYLRVHLQGPEAWANQLITVRLQKIEGQALIGEVITGGLALG